jgi:hypothetical protein
MVRYELLSVLMGSLELARQLCLVFLLEGKQELQRERLEQVAILMFRRHLLEY